MWLNLGLIQKGTCAPFCCSVHSLGWGVGRVRGAWRAPNFSKQLVFRAKPPPRPSLPSNGLPLL